MSVYKICYHIQKENGNKHNSTYKEIILLDQQAAEEFIHEFQQLHQKLDLINVSNSKKLEKMEEFLIPFRKKDLSIDIKNIEIDTYHDLKHDSLTIQSNFPNDS
ncbi:MAG: hypothetical protein EU543_02105 [Promethearchaeota archaeon]|nr:MAG: hypothetical protein EU543_02105 [Candidatus Lokiarchaeota archaeon]